MSMDCALIANLLGLLPAHSDGEPLVLGVACLAGNVVAFCEGLVGAHLVGNGDADLLGNRNTLLLWDVVALLVGNLLGMGLGDLFALIVRHILAGSLDGGPHLVVAMTSPLKLAILLVFSCAFRLGIRLVLSSVLLDTHVLINSVALLLILGMAFLSGGRLAESLDSLGALLLVDRLPDLLLLLLILSVPQSDILGPALDAGRGNLFGGTNHSCSTIVTGSWSSKGHGCKERQDHFVSDSVAPLWHTAISVPC